MNNLPIDDKTAEILNDSMECCFINTISRSNKFETDSQGLIIPTFKTLDKLSVLFGENLLKSIEENANKYHHQNNLPTKEQSIKDLTDALEMAKNGDFTGILTENSPTWSKGKEFLENWPKHLNWVNKKPAIKNQTNTKTTDYNLT